MAIVIVTMIAIVTAIDDRDRDHNNRGNWRTRRDRDHDRGNATTVVTTATMAAARFTTATRVAIPGGYGYPSGGYGYPSGGYGYPGGGLWPVRRWRKWRLQLRLSGRQLHGATGHGRRTNRSTPIPAMSTETGRTDTTVRSATRTTTVRSTAAVTPRAISRAIAEGRGWGY